MINRYERRIFSGKAEAYRSSRVGRIYRYHRALGLVYSALRRWGTSSDMHSAIFQLEHAIKTVKDNNQVNDAKRQVEPQLVALLATAYENAERHSDAVKLKMDACSQYLDNQDFSAAEYLIRQSKADSRAPEQVQQIWIGLEKQLDDLKRQR
ncbi:MAG: hypothetical protein KDB22_27825 [Planctomycetales bacterium]|nr:hypothetical protein [Planctomycetales bacterium]